MTTIKSVTDRVRTVSKSFASSAALSHYARTGGECSHCGEVTQWVTRPLAGFYRCEECGRNPLRGKEEGHAA